MFELHLNPRATRIACKQMMISRPSFLVYAAFQLILPAYLLYTLWTIVQHMLDSYTILVFGVVFLGLTALVIAAMTPYKLWTIICGGQLYFLGNARISVSPSELMLIYHPRKDRYFPTSIGITTFDLSKPTQILVNPSYKLITIQGHSTFSLIRSVMGLEAPVSDANTKYSSWKFNQFIFTGTDQEASEFFKQLTSRGVKIVYC